MPHYRTRDYDPANLPTFPFSARFSVGREHGKRTSLSGSVISADSEIILLSIDDNPLLLTNIQVRDVLSFEVGEPTALDAFKALPRFARFHTFREGVRRGRREYMKVNESWYVYYNEDEPNGEVGKSAVSGTWWTEEASSIRAID